MAYEKKVWVNNQTKLSAANMNHIEEGLAAAASIADTANAKAIDASSQVNVLTTRVTQAELNIASAKALSEAASNAASLASTKADSAVASVDGAVTAANAATAAANAASTKADAVQESIDEVVETVETKQDKLESGTNIKTINGESILGQGDIVTAQPASEHYTVSSVSLDTLTEKGIYSVTSATDSPEGTTANGTLRVTELDDNKIEQEWMSETSTAYRIIDGGVTPEPTDEHTFIYNDGENAVTVKSSSNSQKTITLEACKEYTLSGELFGCINIGTAESVIGNTKLRLNGVNIRTTSNTAINYLPTDKKLTVELVADKPNAITVNEVTEEDRLSTAAIYSSEGNITITGTGALYVNIDHGHAFKASELIFNGIPTIEVEAGHDAFHASKLVRVTGGKYKVLGANDAFSAGTDSDPNKSTVEITVTGGKIDIINIEGSIFDGKSTFGNFQIIGTEINASSGIELYDEHNPATDNNKFKFFDNCTGTACSGTFYDARKVSIDTYFGTGKVYFKPADDEQYEVTESLGIYNLTYGNSDGYYTLTGNLSGKVFQASAEDVDINFKGVYVNDTDASDDVPFIKYTNTAGRLEINCLGGYINIIKRAGGDIFYSESNIDIKVKGEDAVKQESVVITPQKIGILYLTATNGAVIKAPIGRSAIAGDGIAYVTDSKVGVDVACLWLGNEYNKNGSTSWKKSNLSLYLMDNETDAKISWKSSDLAKKYGYITAPYYLLGTCVLGDNITFTEADKKYFEAMTGNVGTVGEQYPNTAIVYTSYTTAVEHGEHLVRFNPEYAPVKPSPLTVVVGEVSNSAGGWIVYTIKDVYTKAEVDATFVKKTVYEEALAMIKALTPKKATLTGFDSVAKKVFIYKYDSDTEPVTVDKAGTSIYARDGEFGYTPIDGTGQINLEVTGLPEGTMFFPTITADKFSNFKSPYAICKDNFYRITKVIDDIEITYGTKIENADTDAFKVTYKLSVPSDYTGTIPTVTIYRTSDALVADYKGQVLNFTKKEDGTYENIVDCTYNKDTGFMDKTVNDTAQMHLKSVGDVAEGYTLSITSLTKNWNKFEADEAVEGAITRHATKVKGDNEVLIAILPPVTITYNPGSYQFSTTASEIPSSIGMGTMLEFKYYYNQDKSAVTEAVTKAQQLAIIDSITVGGKALTLSEDWVKKDLVSGDKKITIDIPGSKITGNVVVTLKTIAADSAE